jgi:hypothetical protein
MGREIRYIKCGGGERDLTSPSTYDIYCTTCYCIVFSNNLSSTWRWPTQQWPKHVDKTYNHIAVIVVLWLSRPHILLQHTHTIICLHSILFFVCTCYLPLAGHVLLFVSLTSHSLHSAFHMQSTVSDLRCFAYVHMVVGRYVGGLVSGIRHIFLVTVLCATELL